MPGLHEVTKKVRETVKQWNLWKRGDSIGIAVSGGIDSMVLLDVVRRRGTPTVFHFNHKLRGEESDQDARFVEKVCQEWKIPFVLGEAPSWKKKSNLQDKAREIRYRFFQEAAKKLGVRCLATAHQADDQAETFLIRWIQGAGLKGLAGIPIVRTVGATGQSPLRIVRPLFFVTRNEITDYAKRFEVPFREDSSNKETKYLRNKVRRILSELRELNPNLAVRSAVNSILLRADEDYLSSLNPPPTPLFEKEGGKGGRFCESNISKSLSLPTALRYRLLQTMYGEASGHSLSGEFVLKIDSLIRDSKPKSQLNLPHGVRFEKDYVGFRFV